MSKSPAFQFYPDDFMGGKPGMMTPEQTHVFIWLLCLDWNQNGFPLDVPTLSRWCHVTPIVFRKAWTLVQECFSSKEGRWFNERLEKERIKQADWRDKSSKGGKTKRQPPTNHPSSLVDENEEPKGQPNGNTPVSSLQSPTPVTTKQPSAKQKRREPAPYMGRVIHTWQIHYPGTNPPPGTATALRSLFNRMGEDAAIEELENYLAHTPANYLNFGKFAVTAGLGPQAAPHPSGRLSPADRISQTIAGLTGGVNHDG